MFSCLCSINAICKHGNNERLSFLYIVMHALTYAEWCDYVMPTEH